jgi:hypothetical protein
VSFVAVLAVWCHPLTVLYAFEARAYGAWFAVAAWLCYLLARSRRERDRLLTNVLLAFLAALVCMIHYFGVLTLALILAAELIARRRAGVTAMNGLLAAALGPLVLLAWAPMVLHQRGAATVATWVPSPTGGTVWAFFNEVCLDPYLAGVVLLAWLAEPLGLARREGGRCGGLDLQASLTGLLLLPLVLVLFSLFQPALVSRYALPAVAGLGALTAWLLRQAPRTMLIIAGSFLVLAGTREAGVLVRFKQAESHEANQLISALRAAPPQELILFESPARLYVVCRYAPDLAGRCALIDFEEGEIGNVSTSRLFVRDLARRYAEFYGGPHLLTWAAIQRLPHAYLAGTFVVPGQADSTRAGPYPGFAIRTLSKELAIYEFLAQKSGPPEHQVARCHKHARMTIGRLPRQKSERGGTSLNTPSQRGRSFAPLSRPLPG